MGEFYKIRYARQHKRLLLPGIVSPLWVNQAGKPNKPLEWISLVNFGIYHQSHPLKQAVIQKNTANARVLLPVLGCIIYVVLYVIATQYYPGGSQADKNSTGYSWVNNYWCNLLYANGINGKPNPAQPIAMTAMAILCLSISLFWIQFPKYTTLNILSKKVIQVCGTLAMVTGFLLYTDINHDLIINVASSLGLIAMIGTFAGLYRNGWKTLFLFGLLNIVMVVLNNVFYHTEGLIVYLPVIQKFSFAIFLLWISSICIKISILTKTQ